MDLILAYLVKGDLPGDDKEAYVLRRKVIKFVMIANKLCRKSLTYQLLKYLDPTKVYYFPREIHKRISGNYIKA